MRLFLLAALWTHSTAFEWTSREIYVPADGLMSVYGADVDGDGNADVFSASTAAALAVVALSEPRALVATPRGTATLFLGESAAEARGATVTRAPSFMPTALASAVGSAAPFLVGEADSLLWSEATRGRLVALPLAEALVVDDVDWLPLSAFVDDPFYSLAAAAISRVASFRAAVSAPDDVSVLGVDAGARGASLLHAPKPLAVPDAPAWERRLAGAARTEAKLRAVLSAADGALLEWAGQVGRVDASDVPECLRGEEGPSPSLVDVPFSEVFVAESTARMKLHPQAMRAPANFCPRRLEGIYDAEAVAAIREWVVDEAAQMRTYAERRRRRRRKRLPSRRRYSPPSLLRAAAVTTAPHKTWVSRPGKHGASAPCSVDRV